MHVRLPHPANQPRRRQNNPHSNAVYIYTELTYFVYECRLLPTGSRRWAAAGRLMDYMRDLLLSEARNTW